MDDIRYACQRSAISNQLPIRQDKQDPIISGAPAEVVPSQTSVDFSFLAADDNQPCQISQFRTNFGSSACHAGVTPGMDATGAGWYPGRRGDEDGLARIVARLEPGPSLPRLDIQRKRKRLL